MDLEESEEGYIGEWRRRKKREERSVAIIITSKILFKVF